MNAPEFRSTVVIPALKMTGLYSRAAEDLLVGTAIQESGLKDINQRGGGPAKGYFQMERATHDDIWANYLAYHTFLAVCVRGLAEGNIGEDSLEIYPRYAAAMARVLYRRAADPLPDPGNPTYVADLAAYWKRFYNTTAGAGTEAEFVANWNALIDVA